MIRNCRCCGLGSINEAWHPSDCLGHMLLGKHSNMTSLDAAEDQYTVFILQTMGEPTGAIFNSHMERTILGVEMKKTFYAIR